MLIPQPESDLRLSTFALGAELIAVLRPSRSYVVIEDLMDRFLKKDPRRTPEAFLDTLTFLYALKVVEVQGYKVRVTGKRAYTQSSLF